MPCIKYLFSGQHNFPVTLSLHRISVVILFTTAEGTLAKLN
jgi:hypothetical protein